MEHAASDALNDAENGVGAIPDSQQSGSRLGPNASNDPSDATSAADLAASGQATASGTAAGDTAVGGTEQSDASSTPHGGNLGDSGTPVPSHSLGSPFASSAANVDDTQQDDFQEGALSDNFQGDTSEAADRLTDPSDSLTEGHSKSDMQNAAMGSTGPSDSHVSRDTSAVPAGELSQEQHSNAADVDAADVDNAAVESGADGVGTAPDLTVVGRGITHPGAGDICLPQGHLTHNVVETFPINRQ